MGIITSSRGRGQAVGHQVLEVSDHPVLRHARVLLGHERDQGQGEGDGEVAGGGGAEGQQAEQGGEENEEEEAQKQRGVLRPLAVADALLGDFVADVDDQGLDHRTHAAGRAIPVAGDGHPGDPDDEGHDREEKEQVLGRERDGQAEGRYSAWSVTWCIRIWAGLSPWPSSPAARASVVDPAVAVSPPSWACSVGEVAAAVAGGGVVPSFAASCWRRGQGKGQDKGAQHHDG